MGWTEISPAKISGGVVLELDAIETLITLVARRRRGIIFDDGDNHAMTAVIVLMIGVCLVGNIDTHTISCSKSPCH